MLEDRRGTGGYGAFDDDTASDFLHEVTEGVDDVAGHLRAALLAVGEEDRLDCSVSVPARRRRAGGGTAQAGAAGEVAAECGPLAAVP
ncbi:DUF4259 domain-containing protein [Nocardia thailandica]